MAAETKKELLARMELLDQENWKLKKENQRLGKELKKAQKQASFDELTGIPNYRSFTEKLNTEWERAKREKEHLAILMIDIDFFKKYNDTYGHIEGNQCLAKIARAIKETLKRGTDFAARCGGEEFGVILPNTSEEGALRVAEAIRTNIEKIKIPHESSEIKNVVTVSIGVAIEIPRGKRSNSIKLNEKADEALYAAKDMGRNRVELLKSIQQNSIIKE